MSVRRWFLYFILLFPVFVFAEGTRTIAILFDVSKSIPPNQFQQAKEAVAQTIQQGAPGETISIYAFGDSLRKVDPADLRNLQAVESNTMMFDALYDVARELAETKADRKAIWIISDGIDTKSVTVLEDAVAFANQNGISVYGVGVGKVNRKSLERIVRLTGGKLVEENEPDWLGQLQTAVGTQKEVTKKEPPVEARSGTPVTTAPAVVAPPVSRPVEQKKPFPYFWVAAFVVAGALLGAILFVISRSFRDERRICPTCGKRLEAYQTICPDCTGADTKQTRKPKVGGEDTNPLEPGEEELIPVELLEKKPMSEEDLSKTYVLLLTPMLVVRKGKNLGQTFSLNRAFPVSMGRSRVNEIHLDDVTVSGQHCRIIPEDGKNVLYDLGSTNGTYVNDKRVNKAVLKEGDTIKVGETQFLYKVEQHRN